MGFFPLKQPLKALFLFLSDKPHFLAKSLYQQKNQNLESENLALKLQIKELEHFAHENQSLRKALKLAEAKGISIQAADIITFSPTNWRRNAFLNKGVNDNVNIGDIAIDENANLLGKIVDAGNETSQIFFADDPEFKSTAFIGEHTFGLLSGNLTGAKLLYVEDGENINSGDTVWMLIPGSQLIIDVGKVRNVQKNDNSLFWDIEVSLFTRKHISKRVFLIQ
ncbi:MAG: rod shape-determining protein MreC [Candidatus Omnitrophica bacterium]|nr:rod shape-determining protein MreC [Candidatus Omnitrophota bacterium]